MLGRHDHGEYKYEVNTAMNGARTAREKIVLATVISSVGTYWERSQADMIERAGRVRLHDAFPAS